MVTNADSVVQSMDASTLTPIVRKAVQQDGFVLQEWSVRQLGGGVGNPVSAGLYRFAGIGQAQGEQMQWSVILKIIQSPANLGLQGFGEGNDQSHWNYWKREPLVYQSGLLNLLPMGMTAPCCYEVVDLPGNITWLWLEDITDAEQGNWSLERYALTARHFGQMNGYFAMQPSWLSSPWLGRNRLTTWSDLIPWRSLPWDHPLIQNRYSDGEQNTFHRILLEGEHFFAKLEQLPKTICHGDTFPTNFMSRRLPDGSQQTVALDWALASVSALGEDLGQLIYGAQINLKTVSLIDVDKVLFESYLHGLHDSGYMFDPQQVRFMFATASALQIGLFQLYLFSEQLKQSNNTETILENPNQPDCYEVRMAKEAFRLLDMV